jgi:hypothetical protein
MSTIRTEARQEDAQLVVQLCQFLMQSGANRGTGVVCREDFPQDYHEFEEQFPLGTDERSQVHALCGFHETVATLWKHGLISEELLFDWLAADLVWENVRGILLGMREDEEEPRLWENFEALAEAQLNRNAALAAVAG